MDKRQYYLQKIAEESLEVATAAMKCIQFGNDSRDPSDPDGLSNIDHLVYELRDLDGAIRAADNHGILDHSLHDNSYKHSIDKVTKIDKYYDLCVKLGTVTEQMLGAGAIGSATGFDPAGCVFESHALCQITL